MAVHSDHESPGPGDDRPLSPGDALDLAHKVAGAACGQIIGMVARRRLSRSLMEWAAGELERAAKIIRTSLPPKT